MKGRWLTLALLIAAAPVTAQNTPPVVEMEGTAIIGEQERPRLRFDIPWQSFPAPPPPARPWTSRIRVPAVPLDRDYFRQLLRFKSAGRIPRGPRAGQRSSDSAF